MIKGTEGNYNVTQRHSVMISRNTMMGWREDLVFNSACHTTMRTRVQMPHKKPVMAVGAPHLNDVRA